MKAVPNTPSLETPGAPARRLGWILPLGFAVLAAVLFLSPRLAEIPINSTAAINPAQLSVGPLRTAMTDPPHTLVEGLPENCNACHQIFNSSSPPRAVLNYHQDVRVNHGLNDRCVNCHDVKDRELLTLRDGTTVTFAQTPQLCSQCHGTVFRDWERGTHGKTLGSWVTGSQLQRRLSCNECHNPHSPRYNPMAPLPAPNTLRMGDQSPELDHEPPRDRSPLRKRIHAPSRASPAAPVHDAPRTEGTHP